MENCFEMMVARCIKIGTVQTLTMLGLLPEVVTISQAEDIYGKRLITEWREKAWIKFYPANNKERGKYYVKRSELETDRKSTRLNSSHDRQSRMPSSA